MARAVVVGAGIGGLAAAVGLRRRGWDVVVLERTTAFAPVGAGLTLMPNGLAALYALGVGTPVRDTLQPYEAAAFRARSGRLLARVPAPHGAAGAGVHRATLHRLLVSALPPEAVLNGCAVTGIATSGVGTGPGPVVTYRRGETTEPSTLAADLLVAADGIGSTVRTTLWPDAAPPADVGAVAWRGVTSEPATLRDAEVSWAPGTEVGLVPLEDGRVYWYVCVTSDRAAHPGDRGHLADARAAAEGWYPAVLDAMEATDADGVLRTELRHLLPAPATYVRGSVALLGDAAHAMPPYVGQGANQALEDAAVLAAVARPEVTVAEALREYDRRRRPRARGVARAARLAGRGGHQVRSQALVTLRDAAIRSTPAPLLRRSLARLTTWQAPTVPVG